MEENLFRLNEDKLHCWLCCIYIIHSRLDSLSRNSSDRWLIMIWRALIHSSCQTVYPGSGLPTRKSVLNHSMTSTFSLLLYTRYKL